MATTSMQIKRNTATRQAAIKNPELDFSTPDPLASLSAESERLADLAELEQLFKNEHPLSDTPDLAPAAKFDYSRASHLFGTLELEASKVRGIAAKHRKYVKYDRENPDDYADAGGLTWSTPFRVLLTLNEAAPEARFVAIEIFSHARWHMPYSISLMNDSGCEAVHEYVVAAALRIAVFLQSDRSNLFDADD